MILKTGRPARYLILFPWLAASPAPRYSPRASLSARERVRPLDQQRKLANEHFTSAFETTSTALTLTGKAKSGPEVSTLHGSPVLTTSRLVVWFDGLVTTVIPVIHRRTQLTTTPTTVVLQTSTRMAWWDFKI